MKLVVLAGAKKGAAVPIKKDVFIIGRSKECALRAGSEAISRKHCELKVTDNGLVARDLGSRNGTYVNDEKIDGPRTLSNGDLLRIGPLEFRYEAEGELKQAKQPKVQSVGDAVARSASKAQVAEGGSEGGFEDSISDWLIGGGDSGGEGPSIGETLTMRTDETRIAREAAAKAIEEAGDQAEAADSENAETAEHAPEDENGKKKKKEPGKLPFRPDEPKSKDSREAAIQVLRDMARRR